MILLPDTKLHATQTDYVIMCAIKIKKMTEIHVDKQWEKYIFFLASSSFLLACGIPVIIKTSGEQFKFGFRTKRGIRFFINVRTLL
jgi:hypothetical protein